MKPKAPNGLAIAGALNVDGSVREASLTIEGSVVDWVLGPSDSPAIDPLVLVDAEGGRWDRDQVEMQAMGG